MNKFINCKNLIAIAIILLLNSINSINSSCLGCVELNELTFNKIVGKFQYTLVKFDIAFPFGDKHEAYSEFAAKIAIKYPELLVALVGVKDYGDKDNAELAVQYEILDKSYPHILLFTNETIKINKEFVRWPKYLDINFNNIQKFVRDNTNFYVGMDGCIREYDLIAIEFLQTENKQDRIAILEKAKASIGIYHDDKENSERAKFYIIFMEKILEKGLEFVETENDRLKNLLKGKTSEKKKLELSQKLNILKQFKIPPPKGPYDEL